MYVNSTSLFVLGSPVDFDRKVMNKVILVIVLNLALVNCSNYEGLIRPRKSQNVTRKPNNQSDQHCGLRKISARSLIVGGSDTYAGEWPWHAAVFHVGDEGRSKEYKCGGTLINGSFILTTASCARYGVDKPEGAIIVELGQNNLQESSAHAQAIPVIRSVVHDKYEYGRHKYDIAILQLKTSVKYSNYVQPACLPKLNEVIEDYETEMGTIVGWGFIEAGELSNTLQSAEVPVIPFLPCLQSDRDFFAQELYDGMYCAGQQNGTAPCFGDAGGGMYFHSGRTWTLRGIVSFTSVVYSVTGGCNTHNYFGLVNVNHFLPWIEDTIVRLRTAE
ncbi:venom protease-like [Armigeres subalbatus]|uniref:venom protease-like n=1 Tax=Armigeres subalbatus TaxID=124917 RepID=UPI002ED63881